MVILVVGLAQHKDRVGCVASHACENSRQRAQPSRVKHHHNVGQAIAHGHVPQCKMSTASCR